MLKLWHYEITDEESDETSKSEEENRRHSLGWAAEELVIKPLLRRFGDPSEKCRILSIVILHKCVTSTISIASLFAMSRVLSFDVMSLQVTTRSAECGDSVAPLHNSSYRGALAAQGPSWSCYR